MSIRNYVSTGGGNVGAPRDAVVVRVRDRRAAARFDVMRLLRRAAGSGASAVFLLSNLRPSIRISGDVVLLDDEDVVTPANIQTALIDFIPDRDIDPDATAFSRDIPEIGRVRCRAMRDRRGPGVIFTMLPAAAVVSTRLSLPTRAVELCAAGYGLVIVCGERASGKSTIVAALVEHIVEDRRDYLITLEEQLQLMHEGGAALVSQREVADANMPAAIRAALSEDPDVLVIDELRSADAARAALEAAGSGRLVVCALTAPEPSGALERLLGMFAEDERLQICAALASSLRGVVAQRLIRRVGQGRSPARALLVNSPGVSALLAAGRLGDLKPSIEAV